MSPCVVLRSSGGWDPDPSRFCVVHPLSFHEPLLDSVWEIG